MKAINKLLAGCTLAASLAACQAGFELNTEGDGDQSNGSSGTFIGPGDDASWTLSFFDDDTFELEKRPSPDGEIEYTASGDVEELASGFFELTVEDDDDGLANVSGDTITLFRVSDTLSFLMPVEAAGDETLIMITEDDCPSGTLNGNFIAVELDNGVNLESEVSIALGTFEYDPSNETEEVTLESVFAIDDEFSEIDNVAPFSTGECEDGITSDAEGSEVYLSDEGNAIFPGQEQSGRFLVLEESSPNSDSDTDGDYIGFLVNDATTDEPRSVFVTCLDGQCTVNERPASSTDIEDTTPLYTLDISDDLNEPTDGFIEGRLITIGTEDEDDEDEQVAGNIACNFNEFGSDVFLACIGQAPEENELRVNLYLVND